MAEKILLMSSKVEKKSDSIYLHPDEINEYLECGWVIEKIIRMSDFTAFIHLNHPEIHTEKWIENPTRVESHRMGTGYIKNPDYKGP